MTNQTQGALRLPSHLLIALFFFGLWLLGLCQSSFSQNLRRDLEILEFLQDAIRENYYDPSYRGIDLKAHFKSYEEKLKQSKSDQESMALLAACLLAFDDSHTRFLPPAFEEQLDPGWEMMMMGETCVIIQVDPQSDAEKQGVRVGDVVISIDGVKPLRQDLWKIEYLFRYLNPLKVRRLVVQTAGQAPRTVTAAVRTEKFHKPTEDELIRRYQKARDRNVTMVYPLSAEVGLWKIPDLVNYDDKGIEQILEKIKGYKKLVLDLRGNHGGYATISSVVFGCLFNRELKLYEVKDRKGRKPSFTKPHKKGAFEGEIVVLVDSRSASGAELIARVLQIEKRARVIGDRTAGKVMRSQTFSDRYFISPTAVVRFSAWYGVQVSISDLIMTDGKSLESVGVQPDELLLPQATDIANQRDPVLARAAMILGATLDPVKAGALLAPLAAR